MTLTEMHVWFRQMAQQMGIQNVRAILPEQIDLLINTSIDDIVNQLIKENIGITNDRIITDNSKIGQINALRTLYKVKEISMGLGHYANENDFIPLSGATTYAENGGIGTDPPIEHLSVSGYFGLDESRARIGKLSTEFSSNVADFKIKMPNYLFICDFSISYKPASIGLKNITVTKYIDDGQETNYFPVRIIDDAYLADVLNDFILKPRLRSPIMVTYNNGTFDLYIDRFTKDEDNGYKLVNNLVPYKLRFSYIAAPQKVKYREDLNADNIECDLPENLHIPILKHAVDLYHTAISGSMQAAQQQEQNQQRENVRNNYRNEDYPQSQQQ